MRGWGYYVCQCKPQADAWLNCQQTMRSQHQYIVPLGNNLKKALPSRHAQHPDTAQNQANRMLRMAAQTMY
jgi:hypothetical protein